MNTLKLLSLCFILVLIQDAFGQDSSVKKSLDQEKYSQDVVKLENLNSIKVNVILNDGMAFVASVDPEGNIIEEHFSIPDYFESDHDDKFYISQVDEKELSYKKPQLFSKEVLLTRESKNPQSWQVAKY